MSRQWPAVPLSEILIKADEWIDIKPAEQYREVTVRLWGKGVVQRREVMGAEISATRRQIVRSQQFILSRIDARNGAFGLIPDFLDGAIVSNDFPVFNLNRSRIVPEFLNWMSKTEQFINLCKKASEGTTNRVRLKEERFLETGIPLPSVSEQRRIVARIEELAVKIEEAHALRRQAMEEAKALVDAGRRDLIGKTPTETWIPVSAFVDEIESGKSPACEGRPANTNEWGVLKVGAVSFGVFDERQNKALPFSQSFDLRYEVKPGDFLMSRANTTDLVGACAIVERTRPKLLLSDKTFRFRFKKEEALTSSWLAQVMKSPALRDQITKVASGTSPTMKNISKEKVLALLMPPHTEYEQRQLVTTLEMLQGQIDLLKSQQIETANEINALLPAILDKAFKGEL